MNFIQKMFENRKEAGHRLAKLLVHFKDNPEVIVVGVPRGGVEVAQVIAMELHLPLELLLVKKLSHPFNEEVAIGAVTVSDVLINNMTHYDQEWLTNEITNKQKILQDRTKKYHVHALPNLKEKVVLLVDDGIATGNTVQLCIDIIRRMHPTELHLVVPICPIDVYNTMKKEVDFIHCIEFPASFQSISQFYRHFEQVSDAEVIKLISDYKKSPVKTGL